jgi:plasmid stability protein
VEFLLPERVVAALRVEAAESGVSLSIKLLEILRNSGYPVIDEDFVDIRKLPKR